MVTVAYGIGLISAWGVLWTATLIIFADARGGKWGGGKERGEPMEGRGGEEGRSGVRAREGGWRCERGEGRLGISRGHCRKGRKGIAAWK